jgi:hypothetical protein
MIPCCQVCGSKRTADAKQPSLCYYMCYWLLEGWLGFNARTNKVAIRDQRAFQFVPDKLSYPKTIAKARSLGWRGRENVTGTFLTTASHPW